MVAYDATIKILMKRIIRGTNFTKGGLIFKEVPLLVYLQKVISITFNLKTDIFMLILCLMEFLTGINCYGSRPFKIICFFNTALRKK